MAEYEKRPEITWAIFEAPMPPSVNAHRNQRGMFSNTGRASKACARKMVQVDGEVGRFKKPYALLVVGFFHRLSSDPGNIDHKYLIDRLTLDLRHPEDSGFNFRNDSAKYNMGGVWCLPAKTDSPDGEIVRIYAAAIDFSKRGLGPDFERLLDTAEHYIKQMGEICGNPGTD